MIDHIVMLNLAEGHAPAELAAIMDGLLGLVGDMPGLVSVAHGPNIDLEHKSPDYPYGFIVQFTDRAALEAYAVDPRHQALGARLVALCNGGGDGILVIDLERA